MPDADAEEDLGEAAQENLFRFEGFYYDTGIKSYDMFARSYRPEAAQFLGADRYESAGADLNLQVDPLTQNRYQFAGGNPISNVEFDGHYASTSGWAGNDSDTVIQTQNGTVYTSEWQVLDPAGTIISLGPPPPPPPPDPEPTIVSVSTATAALNSAGSVVTDKAGDFAGSVKEDWQEANHTLACAWGGMAALGQSCDDVTIGDRLGLAVTWFPFNPCKGSWCTKVAQAGGGLVRGVAPAAASLFEKAAAIARAMRRGGGATDELVPTVAALTRNQDVAVAGVMRDSNRLSHIFEQKGKHDLQPLVDQLGSREAVVREAVLRIPTNQPEGVFTDLTVAIGPHPITITGNVQDGKLYIGNFWVQK